MPVALGGRRRAPEGEQIADELVDPLEAAQPAIDERATLVVSGEVSRKHLQREERRRERAAHVVGDARRERLELVGAQLLHPDEAPRAPEPEPGERARDQAHTRSATIDSRRACARGAVGLEGHLSALIVVVLDQLRERLAGFLHRGLPLAPRLGLGLGERPGLDARPHAVKRALGGIEAVARVRPELAFAREERDLRVRLQAAS